MEKVILSKNKPVKSLTRALRKTGGRNKAGRITTRHIGGGAKRRYRIIDFGQSKMDQKAVVQSVNYDPNRTCHIALVKYEDGSQSYILCPKGLKTGDSVIVSDKTNLAIGNRMKLKNIPVGTFVHNIELVAGSGGKMARAAGSYAEVMALEGKYTSLKMPSSEIRKVLSECFASIGELSNAEHRFQKIGKAGRNRLKGKRPTVRGSAMNPVDHPHGGGEGRVGIGMKYPKTPWGRHALGVKTRKRKKWTNKLIVQRRINKKRK